jgi:FkbM family methyltransferase
MSELNVARRAITDILSVCRHARPVSSARWLTSFAAHLAECLSARSLIPADRIWTRTGARFRLPGGVVVALPAAYTAGSREMYCRNVYMRTGFVMPRTGWVIDLGANRGLFSVWAALAGAQVIAVEAQQGFGPEIRRLAAHNGVENLVHVETAVAGGLVSPGVIAGVLADDVRWAASSHGAPQRPAAVSVPQLMSAYHIDTIGLLKADIEGGEFAVFGPDEDLDWLGHVDQLVMEAHGDFGDVAALVDRFGHHGFAVDLRDNEGRRVSATSGQIDYIYCRRPGHDLRLPQRLRC